MLKNQYDPLAIDEGARGRDMSKSLRLTAEQYQAMRDKKLPRVRNVKRKMVNGIEFDSTREARRYQDLALMQTAGQIVNLRRQVPFEIRVNQVYICSWLADFTYTTADGCKIVEDSKGFKTEIFKLKCRLVEAQYGIRILVT